MDKTKINYNSFIDYKIILRKCNIKHYKYNQKNNNRNKKRLNNIRYFLKLSNKLVYKQKIIKNTN